MRALYKNYSIHPPQEGGACYSTPEGMEANQDGTVNEREAETALRPSAQVRAPIHYTAHYPDENHICTGAGELDNYNAHQEAGWVGLWERE